MSMRSRAGLSLDLDNLWSYMRIHGDPGWEAFPSYLDVVVPRFLAFLAERHVSITVFIVGKDATIQANHRALRSVVDAGHEVGNHSHMHEPWLHRYTDSEIDAEIGRAHAAIASATGCEPAGFRGPGFSLTPAVLESLHRHGYRYDSTTLPTYIGPLARWYYFRGAELDEEQSAERGALFGSFKDGFQPNRPYRWKLAQGSLLELPVTTFPIIKVPFHFSYLLYLSGRSPRLANAYLSSGLELCRRLGFGPTLLLHPLDFLDASDAPQLEFFPGMDIDAAVKIGRLGGYLDRIADRFDIGSMSAYVDKADRATTGVRTPR